MQLSLLCIFHHTGGLLALLLGALLLVAMPGAPSSFLLLVVRPGAPSSVLVVFQPKADPRDEAVEAVDSPRDETVK